jgi:hypothetical protein
LDEKQAKLNSAENSVVIKMRIGDEPKRLETAAATITWIIASQFIPFLIHDEFVCLFFQANQFSNDFTTTLKSTQNKKETQLIELEIHMLI